MEQETAGWSRVWNPFKAAFKLEVPLFLRNRTADIASRGADIAASLNSTSSIIDSTVNTTANGARVAGAIGDVSESSDSSSWLGTRLFQGFLAALSDQHELYTSGNSDLYSRMWGVFSYCCSLYGFTCLMLALILDRTMTLASANDMVQQQLAIERNRGNGANGGGIDGNGAGFGSGSGSGSTANGARLTVILKKTFTVVLRLLVIGCLLYNGYNVLVALKLVGQIGSTTDNPWFLWFLQNPIFDYDVDKFAQSKYMKTPKTRVMIGPDVDMYWPIFLTFGLLAFVETFCSVVQGKKPSTESGITLFEHSVGFQEAGSRTLYGYNRSPTEHVLFTCLYLIANHLNIQIGGIINDNKYKLIPLSITGVLFLAYVFWCIYNLTFLGFPSMFFSSLLPQVLLVVIIGISVVIFGMAFAANGFRLGNLNFASFLLSDEEDEEDDLSHRLNISLADDFYKCLWSVGMFVITLAAKSSYITELSLVAVDKETWLERGLRESLRKRGSASKNVAQFLKKNNVSGYSNIVQLPSLRMITGKDEADDEIAPVSIYRTRYQYLFAALSRFGELVYGLVVKRFWLTFVPSLFFWRRRRETNIRPQAEKETAEHFEARKQSVPSYLRKYMKIHEAEMPQPEAGDKTEEDGEYDEEDEDVYIKLLLGREIPEIDNSGDYEEIDNNNNEEEEEEDNNSDNYDDSDDEEYETVDLRGGTILRGDRGGGGGGVSTSMEEFMNVEEFNDLIRSPDIGILQSHLLYNGSGRLTRSKYVLLQHEDDRHRDEGEKLLDLILATRKDSQEARTHREDLQERLICVICQLNHREIITWPCKCFAICESCRLSLVSKGMEGCVCCRRDVEGVTKVYIP